MKQPGRCSNFASLTAIAAVLLATIGASPAPTGAPVEIPTILPLTGPAAEYGQSLQQGFRVLEKYVNATGGVRGRPVRFAFLDDQASPALAVQLATPLISGGAQVLIGGALSGSCKATLPLVEKGPVLYCISPSIIPPRNGNVFSGSIYSVDYLAATLRFFRDRGLNRIGFLTSTDATGQEIDRNVPLLLARPEFKNLRVVAHEHFNVSDLVVSAQFTSLKAANPQALVLWSAQGIGTVFKGLRDSGMKQPVLISTSHMIYHEMNEDRAFLPAELYFASPKWAAYPKIGNGPVKDALREYFKAFSAAGIRPDVGGNLAWDPGLIVVSALRKLGPDATAVQIHDYIENLHDWAGSNGYYDFRTGDQRGLNPNDVIVVRWDAPSTTWVLAH
jgi:branched-chain amino acid transport system substrate-binding protein